MEPSENPRHCQPRCVLRVALPLLMLICLGRTYFADNQLSWSMAVVRGEMKRLAPISISALIDQAADGAGFNITLQTQTPRMPEQPEAIALEITSGVTTPMTTPTATSVQPPQHPSTTSMFSSSLHSDQLHMATANLQSTVASATESTSQNMSSLFYLVDQENLQRGKAKCPDKFRVSEWNGRIGNHYFQVSQVIVAALFCRITHVTFPPHISTRYQQQDGLLDMPQELALPGIDGHEGLNIPSTCPAQTTHKWYHQHCRMVPAWHHYQVMQAFLRPYLGQTLADLVRAPSDEGERVLTIHLRADDIRQYGRYEWAQPPCSMYQKIVSEFGYQSLKIIAKSNPATKRSDAACDSWLVDYAKKHGISIIRPQDFTLAAEPQRLILSEFSHACDTGCFRLAACLDIVNW